MTDVEGASEIFRGGFVASSRAAVIRLLEIPESLLEQYRRIASARDGVALVAVTDQSCQACNVRLRPQLFAEVKASQHIMTCESCNRILYYAGS